MQREHAIRQLAKLEGYRLEKKKDGSYCLINTRFNVAGDASDFWPVGGFTLARGPLRLTT